MSVGVSELLEYEQVSLQKGAGLNPHLWGR